MLIAFLERGVVGRHSGLVHARNRRYSNEGVGSCELVGALLLRPLPTPGQPGAPLQCKLSPPMPALPPSPPSRSPHVTHHACTPPSLPPPHATPRHLLPLLPHPPSLTNPFLVPASIPPSLFQVTSMDRLTLNALLERLGLRHLFSAVVCAEDGMDTLAQSFLSAAIKLGRPPNQCVVFGACPASITAAHNCTMKVIGLGWRAGSGAWVHPP